MEVENKKGIPIFQFFSRSKKNWLVGILIVLWAFSTLFSFWWFQFRNMQAFDLNAAENKTVFFESGKLGNRLERLVKNNRLEKKAGVISVVHFWNPDCPCSRFNQPHVKNIISDYADKNVRFTVVVSGETKEIRKQNLAKAKQIFSVKGVTEIRSDWPMEKGPVSSPAAGVINSQGELMYFGPYSLGARCSPDKGKFVEKIIDSLKDKNKPSKKQLNTLAVGCFCPWASNKLI